MQIQKPRGTKDIYGNEIIIMNKIIDYAREIANIYNFNEINTPIFESSSLFERNLGDESDVVQKEIYKFQDKSNNFIALRPEFTASVVRALIENNLDNIEENANGFRLFSFGSVFRYDRPQKGRQRQFNQLNFELFGNDTVFSDVDIINCANDLIKKFVEDGKYKIEVNYIGNLEAKKKYENAIKDFLAPYKEDLSDDSKRRLATNPLRILDSKDKTDRDIIKNCPSIMDFLTQDEVDRFQKTIDILKDNGLNIVENNNIVRGLDYYTGIVFEFTTNELGSQGTILAGGRYNNLVEKISCGKKNIPAIGFACGLERLTLMQNFNIKKDKKISVIPFEINDYSLMVIKKLRDFNIRINVVDREGGFSKKIKLANKIRTNFAIIIGKNEEENKSIVVKNMDTGDERDIKINEINQEIFND